MYLQFNCETFLRAVTLSTNFVSSLPTFSEYISHIELRAVTLILQLCFVTPNFPRLQFLRRTLTVLSSDS